MAVNYPTPDEVKQAFVEALPDAQAFDPQRWSELERAVLDPRFQPAGEGIEVLDATGARLFKIHWQVSIDKMNTNLESEMRSRITALQQALKVIIDNEDVSFAAPDFQVIVSGPVTRVVCWTRGTIG
jgi:hypothetical protein